MPSIIGVASFVFYQAFFICFQGVVIVINNLRVPKNYCGPKKTLILDVLILRKSYSMLEYCLAFKIM